MLDIDIEKRLKDFHLRVAFGVGDELVALFGPSGAGKSLTLHCIAGLLRPDRGRIAINGQAVFDSAQGLHMPPQKRHVGYVFQNYALFPHLSVEDNIAYGLHYLRLEERRAKTAEMVRVMRLKGLEKRRPAELSGGQQQRVALARALVTDPAVLLLDEPFSALDSIIRGRLWAELPHLLRPLGRTIILVTHNLEEAYTLSDKIVIYDAGRVLQVGHRDEVIHQPRTRTVARFTGAKNIFRGVVLAKRPHALEIESEGFALTAPPYPVAVGEAVEFCIRPERVRLVRPARSPVDSGAPNQLAGAIVDESAHPATYTLFFKLDRAASHKDYDLHIEIPTQAYRKLGLAQHRHWVISLPQDALHLLEEERP